MKTFTIIYFTLSLALVFAEPTGVALGTYALIKGGIILNFGLAGRLASKALKS